MMSSPDSALTQALALSRQGRMAEATRVLRDFLKQQPAHFDALFMLAAMEIQLGATDSALALLDQAVAIHPRHAVAQFNRGRLLQASGHFEEAVRAMDAALAADPDYARAHAARAEMLAQTGQLAQALEGYARACAGAPNDPAFPLAHGSVLYRLGRFEEALAQFEKAIALHPAGVDAHVNVGCALLKLARPADALRFLGRARQLGAHSEDVHFNLALALKALARHREAIDSVTQALAVAPGSVEALRLRAALLSHLKMHDAALADMDTLLTQAPGDAQGHASRAGLLFEMGRLEESIAGYERALALDADLDFALEAAIQARMAACDWRDFDARARRLEGRIMSGAAVSPAHLLAVSNDPVLQRQCAESYAAAHYPQEAPAIEAAHPAQAGRLRIGYFSGDFFAHATAYLMAGLFEHHDRSKFEIFAFCFGAPTDDAMRARLRAAFDHFIDVSASRDEEVVGTARRLGIDIAVDLKGLTQGARPRIFAMRAAPIQISYLGYPATMGAAYFDYLVADAVVAGQDAHYTEQLIRLPGSYQANDNRRPLPLPSPGRRVLGLPEHALVLCCFNNPYKITPQVFAVWMRLLQQVEGSVLWLLEGSPLAVRNLQAAAVGLGVDPQRLVFAARAAPEAHLSRHGAADLFLDTFPCNAHTTASDALWAGLPLLTCQGQTFASRVAASLLHAAGLPELVTTSLAAYETQALALARGPERLHDLRNRLLNTRHSCALFDTEQFARRLEAGYELAHSRARAGLPPAPLEVEPCEPSPA